MAKSKTITRNDIQNILAHINLGDDAHREITQAEFDALSQTDKDDGTIYFITNGASGNVFLDDNTPVGMIAPYGGSNDPAYWLICDGRAVSRTAYAELFAVIGTTYGIGDGSTTFNIPDFRGRTAIGAGTGTATGATNHPLGQTEGAETIKLTDAQMAHGHGMTQPAFTIAKEALTSGNQSANHSHSVSSGLFWHARTDAQVVNGSAATTVEATGNAFFNSARTSGNNSVNHTHKVPSAAYSVPRSTNAAVTDLSGASSTRTAHSNMQPYTVTNYIIKASSAISTNQSQLDYTYPVGSYYETSNLNFNPNIVWGGIWELSSESSINKKWHRIA